MYQASLRRKERAKYFMGELAKEESQMRNTLDKYEKGKDVRTLSKENDEVSARIAHDYFLKLSVILEDHNGNMEWEADLIGRVNHAKILYRLVVILKHEADDRQRATELILDRERCLKEAHQSYLAAVTDP